MLFFFRGLSLLSFDESYSQSIGFPNELLKLVLSITTVVTVAMGVQAVGVVLMSALLITPTACAKFWTNKIIPMAILAVVLSGVSGVLGSAISYTYNGMPTGPWIVVVISLFAFTSAFIGSKHGLLKKYIQRAKNNTKILRENTIKLFFNPDTLGETTFQFEDIFEKSNMQRGYLKKRIKIVKVG